MTDPLLLAVAALAVYRVTRFVTDDSATEPARNWVLARWPTTDTVFTDEWVTDTAGEPRTLGGAEVAWFDGEGWIPTRPTRRGELVSCVWCLSLWVAAAVTAGLWHVDAFGWVWWQWLLLPPALSAVAGLIHRDG